MLQYKLKIKEIQSFKKIPVYIFNFSYSSNLYLEIYINNQLFYKTFTRDRQINDNHFVNHYIKSSGKQKIRIVAKPFNDSVFNEYAHLSFSLLSLPEREVYFNDTWDNKKEILSYKTNEFKRDSEGNLDGYIKEKRLEGKSYFEKEFEFLVESDLENIALKEAQDLRKLNTKILENKVLEQYNNYAKSVNSKEDLNVFWKMVYEKTAYYAKANCFTTNEMESVLKEAESFLSWAKFPPIENYEMVFYDQGRLVCFESKSTDLELRGKSPLVATAVNPKNPKDIFRNPIQFYFYMPQNSTELKVMY